MLGKRGKGEAPPDQTARCNTTRTISAATATTRLPSEIVRSARAGETVFKIGDAGPGFSLNAIAHAAVSNPPEEPLRHTQFRNDLGMRPGGFGILLVKQIADELIYSERGNEVVLVKFLDPKK